LNTQADSQVIASQVQGLGGNISEEISSTGLTPGKINSSGNRLEMTPATAKDSNMSPMTQKTWEKPGAHFAIEEEGLNWEESKGEGDAECSQQKNYKLEKGQVYSGQMRPNPNKPGKNNFIPHGKGTMTMDDGTVIEGLWKNGQVIEGVKFYSNGDRYTG
jgi:hypothetical protein